MPSEFKKSGRKAPMPIFSAAETTQARATADTPLPTVFAQALGGPLPSAGSGSGNKFTAKDTLRQAMTDRPAAPGKGTPRKPHIGPRSGHK
ncbi:MAG: hypothetical protein MEQ84_04990 [Mesorhizobium sp.]|nr:hypothetical protein [Mesorhizobium sp.]